MDGARPQEGHLRIDAHAVEDGVVVGFGSPSETPYRAEGDRLRTWRRAVLLALPVVAALGACAALAQGLLGAGEAATRAADIGGVTEKVEALPEGHSLRDILSQRIWSLNGHLRSQEVSHKAASEATAEPPAPAKAASGDRGQAAGKPAKGGKKDEKKGLKGITERPDKVPSLEEISAARRRATVGQELQEPKVLRSPVSLTMQATKLPTPWIGGHFWTRGYGSIPGPTIRVRPGENLEIHLHNGLGPGPGDKACNFKHSQLGFFLNPATICSLNHTNMHTHGLHVSAEGKGDNIMKSVAPGERMHVSIPLPENHMGGTHWYHPHKHHATAAQAGGGAHGALIVDDPPGALPASVESMPEKMMFLSLVNIAKALRLEHWGMGNLEAGSVWNQTLWKNPTYPGWTWDTISGSVDEHGGSIGVTTGLEPQVVVNGQWQPKVTLDDGKWYRFRFVFAAIEQRVEIHQADSGTDQAYCQYQLISKDGIYLHEAPRPIERIYLVSGSRADVAVSCTCAFLANPLGRTLIPRKCSTQLNFTAKWEPMGLQDQAVTMEEHTDLLMTIVTGHGLSVPDPPIETFSVRRPCYLADLRHAMVPWFNRHTVDLPQIYPMYVKFDHKGQVWGHDTPKPMAYIPVGSIQEWYLSGVRYHPFHSHVNPFQIVKISNDPYYLPGDWHDTLLPTGSGSATVRLNIDTFTGKMVAHCHLLEHEDNGMMGFVQITGREGSTYLAASYLDPQCYTGVYPGPPVPKAPITWR